MSKKKKPITNEEYKELKKEGIEPTEKPKTPQEIEIEYLLERGKVRNH